MNHADEAVHWAENSFFFRDALDLDGGTALRANVGRQDFTVVPRVWYVDAEYRCRRCASRFWFTAEQQRRWFEDFGFSVFAEAVHCLACRADIRHVRRLHHDFNERIAAGLRRDTPADEKRQLLEMMAELEEAGVVPSRCEEKREILQRQLAADDG